MHLAFACSYLEFLNSTHKKLWLLFHLNFWKTSQFFLYARMGFNCNKMILPENALAVQWLECRRTFTAGRAGSVPGQAAKVLRAV